MSPHVTSEMRDANQDRQPEKTCDPNGGRYPKDYGADQQRLQISDLHFDKFPTPTTFACWNFRLYLFTISYESYAVDQRSGDGSNKWWSQIFAFYQRNSWTRLWVARRKNCFSTEQKSYRTTASRKMSVWRKWEFTKKTASSVEDRSLTWSTSTSGSLEPTILSRIVPTYLQLFFELIIFRNSIRNGTKFYCRWHKSHLMTSWKDWTNEEHEGLRNSRPHWNCTIWRFIKRRPGLDDHRLKRMVKRGIDKNLRMKNFEARNGNFETSAAVKNHRMKQREQRSPGDCCQWKANGQCSKGDKCSFRHDMNKRAKSTQPNPSPGSSTQQNVKNASRTRSPRGRSPSGKMARLPCKDYFKGTCTTPFYEKWHILRSACSTSHMQISGKVHLRTARLTNSLARSLKRMVTKVQWLYWRIHDNWVAYFKMWSRRSLHLATNTDTHMSGSTVKNHISFKTVFEYSVTQRTSFRSWFLVCHRVLPPVFPLQHPMTL